ncbi:MAG: hypothetical protein V5A64_01345 [Candidatus Thermoplasmatota archaeon]
MKKTSRVYVSFFFVFIFLFFSVFSGQTNVNSSPIFNKNETYKVKVVFHDVFQSKVSKENFSKNIGVETADYILGELLDLEGNFSGLIKIRKQINVFQKHGILPDSFSVDQLFKCSGNFGNFSFFGGPSLISHLILNGRIKGKIPFWKPLFYWNIYNTTRVKGVTGFLFCFLGASRNPVYISCFDFSSYEFFSEIYLNCFIEFMLSCTGFSLGFYKDDGSTVLFEYNLDFCLFLPGFNTPELATVGNF